MVSIVFSQWRVLRQVILSPCRSSCPCRCARTGRGKSCRSGRRAGRDSTATAAWPANARNRIGIDVADHLAVDQPRRKGIDERILFFRDPCPGGQTATLCSCLTFLRRTSLQRPAGAEFTQNVLRSVDGSGDRQGAQRVAALDHDDHRAIYVWGRLRTGSHLCRLKLAVDVGRVQYHRQTGSSPGQFCLSQRHRLNPGLRAQDQETKHHGRGADPDEQGHDEEKKLICVKHQPGDWGCARLQVRSRWLRKNTTGSAPGLRGPFNETRMFAGPVSA